MILEQNNAQEMEDPIAYAAKNDLDTVYFHQAMKEPDREQFIMAVITEINGHCERKHRELVPMTQVPLGTNILDSVWAMKRKQDIKAQKVYKHKA
eukprot:8296494-Ditylum_brightwellii.AAC.1